MLYLLILVAACRGFHYVNVVKCQGAITIGPSATVVGGIESGGALTIGSNSYIRSTSDNIRFSYQSVGAMSVHNNVSILYGKRVDVGGALTIGDRSYLNVADVVYVTGAVTIGAYTRVIGTVNGFGAFTKGQGTSYLPGDRVISQRDKIREFNIGIQRDVPIMDGDLLELDDKRHDPLSPGKYIHSAAWSLPAGENMTFSGNYTDEWVIYIGGAANIAGNIELIGKARASNIYWVVDGTFTTLAHSTLWGNVISVGVINIGDSATVFGSLHSSGGACNIGGLATLQLPSGVHPRDEH